MKFFKLVRISVMTCLVLVLLIYTSMQTNLLKVQEVGAIKMEKNTNLERTMDAKFLKDYFSYFLKPSSSNLMVEEEFSTEVEELKQSTMNADSVTHSITNNQVEGIEEGDSVVTDGQYIYSIKEEKVLIIDVNSLELKGTIGYKNNGYPSHLMIADNQLIITYTHWKEEEKEGQIYGNTVTTIDVYQVADVSKPVLVNRFGQDGDLINVRKMNNELYVVSSYTPNYWMLETNPNIELRPSIYDSNGKQKLVNYDEIKMLPDANTTSYLIASIMNLTDGSKEDTVTKSYLGNTGQLYMSKEAIYIATTNIGMMPFVRTLDEKQSTTPKGNSKEETTIYKLSINKEISLVSEATIQGRVLNQFSMDEYNGYFRIATTEGSAWDANDNLNNHLFILDENLLEVGSLKNLAKGERIYSARFMGDKAYLVTFKEVDPLFVIDLKDPKAPKVVGELKIPGFSNYMHPIGENHLLGIGYDTELTMNEWSKEPQLITKGMKLSLFNVEDVKNPVEQETVIIGGRGTQSNVQYDHKALFIDHNKNYFGFPVTIYEEGENNRLKYKGTGAQIYQVTPKGIHLAANLIEPARLGEQYEDSYLAIQRILFAKDQLFTVSPWKITSYNYTTFKKIAINGYE